MNEKELLWKEIETDLDLYKFYIELLIKASTFFFAITGGLVAYYLSHFQQPLLRYSLILPVVMNMGFVLVCLASLGKVRLMIKDFKQSCTGAGFTQPYEMSPLLNLLWIFSISYILIICGILYLIFCPECLSSLSTNG